MNPRKAGPPLASIAAISAATLAYEVLLMRLLSIIHWHHFAYMIISVALLGYGVSGTFLALARDWLRGRFETAYIVNAALFGLTAVGGILVAQQLPFNALEVLWDPVQPLWLALIYLLLFLPFFCAANCICLALFEYSSQVHLTYAVDLLGAGAGAIGAIALLYLASPTTALGIVGACGLVAAWLASKELAWGSRLFRLALLGGAAALLLPFTAPSPEMSQFKGLSQALEVTGAAVVDERSSPLGLLTTVRSDRVPFRHAPGLSLNAPTGPPGQLGVFTDGEGMQAVGRFDGEVESLAYLDYLTSALPYHLQPQPEVLVLGSGVGTEVLQALYLGASKVDAVELNRQTVDLVEDTFGDFSGRPYSNDLVRLHIDDARGFVSGTERRFDVVQVALLDAFGASSAGLQALGENYLYTVEGFAAMLRVLRPGGLLSLTRWIKLPPRDGLKSLATAAAALEDAGVARPGEYLVMIRGWSTSTLLVGNRPFSAPQIRQLREFCDERSFDLVHYPGMSGEEANRYNRLQQPWFRRAATSILGPDREGFFDAYKFDLRPATDDRPYFFQFLKWTSIPEILRLRGQGGLPLLEQGYLVLILTLVQSLLISFALILLPLWRHRVIADAAGKRWRNLSYFFVVGTAFMLIEIAFIQKFILFLHHPIFSVATVLGAFLVFAGLGSAISARRTDRHSVTWPVMGIVVISLIYLFTLPWLFDRLLALHLAARIALSVLLIAPLALLMGMPFPIGLRRLARGARNLIPWAWGINGCASVISAVGATLLAVHFGFAWVVVLAVVLYGAAVWLLPLPGGRTLE